MFTWGVRSLVLNSGDKALLEPASMLIIVGPNNGGKSAALRDIWNILYSGRQGTGTVIQNIDWYCNGSEEEFYSWFCDRYPFRVSPNGKRQFYARNQAISEDEVRSLFGGLKNGNEGRDRPSSFLCNRLDATSRLGIGDTKHSIRFDDQPTELIHILQRDKSLERSISEQVKKAFGKDLLPRTNGPDVSFYLGNEPLRTLEQDRLSPEYLAALQQLPRLENEGDGIRSFVGTLLAAKSSQDPLLLVDEPEVFLHPPQVIRLAEILAQSAEDMNRQVIVATHSSDFVRGALASSDRVSVCRLSRQENRNFITQLAPSDIKDTLSKPLLKSSVAIDGVFHEGVIVCEADGDSRFYEALVRRLEANNNLPRAADLYFAHGGGKGQLPTLASVYRRLHVPVVVIADFDLLKDKGEFKNTLNALSKDFKDIEQIYNAALTALNVLPPSKPIEEFVNATRAIVDDVDRQKEILTEHRKALDELLEDSTDWSQAKKYGITRLGETERATCENLIKECSKAGLFLVPNGALESWWRDGPQRDKTKWFVQAVEKLEMDNGAFSEASEFMIKVCKYLSKE